MNAAGWSLRRAAATRQPVRDAAGELVCSPVTAPLRWLYLRLAGPGAMRARRLLCRVFAALEAGNMRSASLRWVMSRAHGIEVEAHAYGCFDPIRFPAGTRVGRYVSIGPGVSAYRRNHPLERLSLHPYFYRPSLGAGSDDDVPTSPLEIQAGCWIGANALILPGCREIGRGSVVAAGAVVTKDVPAYAVIGGNPAKVLSYRFDDQAIAAAEATRWWEKTPEAAATAHDMVQPWRS